jgi:hypothetical protein
MRTLLVSLTVVVFALGMLATPSQAGLIAGFPASGRPDITAGYINVSYSAATGNFTATGYATGIDFDGPDPVDYLIGGTQAYTLTAHITTAGVCTSAALTIAGTVNEAAPQGSNDPLSSSLGSPLLVSQTCSNFGFNPVTNGEIQFIFAGATGSAASWYPVGTAYVKLNLTQFPGNWTQDFSHSNAVSNNFATPEPATMAMLLLGGLPALILRRRALRRAAGR